MSNTRDPEADSDLSMVYQIRIKGHLGSEWTDWFGGMSIALETNGDSVVTAAIIDQAELHGLLRKVRDLGLPLLSVIHVGSNQADVPDAT